MDLFDISHQTMSLLHVHKSGEEPIDNTSPKISTKERIIHVFRTEFYMKLQLFNFHRFAKQSRRRGMRNTHTDILSYMITPFLKDHHFVLAGTSKQLLT